MILFFSTDLYDPISVNIFQRVLQCSYDSLTADSGPYILHQHIPFYKMSCSQSIFWYSRKYIIITTKAAFCNACLWAYISWIWIVLLYVGIASLITIYMCVIQGMLDAVQYSINHARLRKIFHPSKSFLLFIQFMPFGDLSSRWISSHLHPVIQCSTCASLASQF